MPGNDMPSAHMHALRPVPQTASVDILMAYPAGAVLLLGYHVDARRRIYVLSWFIAQDELIIPVRLVAVRIVMPAVVLHRIRGIYAQPEHGDYPSAERQYLVRPQAACRIGQYPHVFRVTEERPENDASACQQVVLINLISTEVPEAGRLHACRHRMAPAVYIGYHVSAGRAVYHMTVRRQAPVSVSVHI